MSSSPVNELLGQFENTETDPATNSNLNSGTDLDGDDAPRLFNPLEFAESKEIEAVVAEVAAMEAVFTELDYLSTAMIKAGGMNQDFAMEAIRIKPDFGNKTPLNFYTKDLSATRYKVSMEEISGTIWAMIAAGIAALVAVVVKMISWLFGDKSDSEGGVVGKAVAKSEKSIEKGEKADEAFVELEKLVISDKTILNGGIDQIVHEYFLKDNGKNATQENHVFKMLNMTNPFYCDIIENKLYSRLFKHDGFLHELKTRIIGQIDNKINAVDKMMEEAHELFKSDVEPSHKGVKQLDEILFGVYMFKNTDLENTVDFVETTWGQYVERVTHHPVKVEFATLHRAMVGMIAELERMTTAFESLEQPMIKLKDLVEHKLANVEKELNFYAGETAYGEYSAIGIKTHARSVRDVVRALLGEINNVRKLFGMNLTYLLTTTQFIIDSSEAIRKLISIVEDEYKTNGHEIPDDLKEIKKVVNSDSFKNRFS